jgi:hypothetical protein
VVDFPPFGESGTWTVDWVAFGDAVGNGCGLTTSDLRDMGFPTELTVLSQPDVVAPSLTKFSFTPTTIDTTSGLSNVTVSFTLTDELSGVSSLYVRFLGPGGQQYRTGGSGFGPGSTNVSGTLGIDFQQSGETGIWTVDWVAFGDAVGNGRGLTTSDLRDMGFPTELTVLTDTTPPVPDVNPLPTISGQCSVTVSAAPTATDDSKGKIVGTTSDALTYNTQGTFIVHWTYDDGNGNKATQTQTVIVKDTAPPIITIQSVNPSTLWPPNKRMIPVVVKATASDNCSQSLCKITNVTSNEPSNSDALATGDAVITGDLSLNLRADRNADGNGRIYTITVQCKDASGNVSSKTTTVLVPHDQKK